MEIVSEIHECQHYDFHCVIAGANKYFGTKMIYIVEYTHGTLLKATSARSDVSGTAYCK
jgi:hypothetical protein